MVHAHPGQRVQRLGGEVRIAADAEARIGDLARALARQRDQFLHRLHRQRRMHEQRERCIGQVGDRDQVADRIVGQLRVHRRRRGDMADRAEQHRVAIGRRTHDEVHADGAGRARAVLDHERLAQLLGHLLHDRPRDEVGVATGRRRDDDAHGLRRPGGCGNLRGRRCGDAREQQRDASQAGAEAQGGRRHGERPGERPGPRRFHRGLLQLFL